MFYIYCLIDPRTSEMRYIGKTNNITVRFRDHLNKMREKNRKTNWIKNLKNSGYIPEIYVLEQYELESDAFDAEIFLISYYRYIGTNLLNSTNGGEGASGLKLSDETKLKISKAHTGMRLSEETKQKLRIINTGKKDSEETKRKKSISGAYKNHPNRKLSRNDYDNIRKLYIDGMSQKKISELYGVTSKHIHKIVKYKIGKIYSIDNHITAQNTNNNEIKNDP